MTLEAIAALVVGASLTFYAVLGGADFGAGIWEFHGGFQTSDRERARLQRAIGPVWEANHVWLIFALVMTHTAFPLAYGAISRALWLPLLLALVGIVFRGAAFVFRAYGAGASTMQARWGVVFACASVAAPFFFGAALGALATGELAIAADGSYSGDYVTGWVTPLGIYTAFFAVGVCSYLSAVYMTREAAIDGDADGSATWRRRALATGSWMGVMAVTGLALVALEAEALWAGFAGGAGLVVAASFVAGIASLVALGKHRLNPAMVAAALAVATVLWGWMLAQWPVIVPPAITLDLAKAPDSVLQWAIAAAGAGMVLLVPALIWLLVLFKRDRRG